MKKLLICMLAGTLALSMGACADGSDGGNETEETEAAASEPQSEEETVPAAEEAGEDTVSTDKISIEIEGAGEESAEGERTGEEAAAEEETSVAETLESAEIPDVADAIDGSATAETDPAPYGSWVKTALYATQDSTYHTVYVRVKKVTTQSEDDSYVQSAIEANNGYGEDYDQFDETELEVPEDGELVVMDYEVYVPEDFPAPNYGMTEPKFYFSMRNVGGGGFPSADGDTVYVGMGTAVDLIVRDASSVYEPGNTYGERCIYAMVTGYTGYVATYSSYPEGTGGEETNTENMYTVYHSIQ